MKNKVIKKSIVALLSLILLVSTAIIDINALSHNVQESFLADWRAVAGGSEGLYGNGTFLTVDGVPSFCLQANKGASTGTNNEVTWDSIGISAELSHKLALIAYFGYRTQPNDTNYVLTQNLIWNTLGYQSYYKGPGYPDKNSMQPFFNDVMQKVDNYQTGPSFTNGTYIVTVGGTISLTDTNNILSSMTVKSSDGLNVSISGNQLNITGTINAKDTSTIILEKGITASATGTNFVVRKGTSQAISPCLYAQDPFKAGIQIKVNKFGSLQLTKQDNKGNYVPNTSFKLAYNEDMTDAIGTYTTLSNGKILVNDLLPKTVYIKETGVPDHLVLDDTVYSKSIVSNTTTDYNSINNWKQGYIQVIKKDSKSKKIVKKAGTTFNVYRKADDGLVATITTNAQGVAKTGLLDYGDYYVKETIAPSGYTINETKYYVNVRTNLATVEQIVEDNEVRGSITLTKEDSETGSNAQGSATLIGARYKLYAKNNILDPADGTVLYSAGTMLGEKTIDANRKIVWDNLYLGDYYVLESQASTGYNIDATKHNVTLSYSNQNTAVVSKSVTSKEDVIKGYIQVVKKDSQSGKIVKKAGAQFNVFRASDNHLMTTITTNANGIAKSGLLVYGEYYIQEKLAPNAFTINTTKYPINVRSQGATIEQVISNNEVRGSITLTKEDSETGANAQGRATLIGAKYKLYAKNNILDPADGTIIYKAGTAISEKTIDANRKIVWDNLYLGDYYVQESQASVGYNIDPTKHDVTLNYVNQNTAIVSKSTTSKENVIRGDIYLVKYLEDSINKPDLQKPGENIVFKITSKTNGSVFYIQTDKYGHASTQSFYFTDVTCKNKVISNSRGALPIDSYTVEEVASTTPAGYKPAGKWNVVISNEKEVLHYIVKNDDITTPVKVVKKDSTTDKVIPIANTEFRLLDADKNQMYMTTHYPETVVHLTFKTGENGYLQFPDKEHTI